MHALVVYESMFGNTAVIARAVADGIAAHADVTLADASTMPDATGMDLVVVGGPTHAFGMSRPSTRQDAARQGQTRPGTTATGMREWLDRSPALTGVAAAAFDTKIDKSFVPGSAAHKAHRRLRRLGCRLVASAESFRVSDTTGPLVAGEPERARRWGETVAEAVRPAGHATV
ncbi:MAG TPA: flavodoxin domain-containing protein [Actinoplanes sp.]|nr:flavodoxin domain-containing protein [Actinoplanes sp.]